jgi:hypothetical protein
MPGTRTQRGFLSSRFGLTQISSVPLRADTAEAVFQYGGLTLTTPKAKEVGNKVALITARGLGRIS